MDGEQSHGRGTTAWSLARREGFALGGVLRVCVFTWLARSCSAFLPIVGLITKSGLHTRMRVRQRRAPHKSACGALSAKRAYCHV